MRYNKKEEIGKLRERIIVQSVSRSVTTSGFGTETWSNLAEVWAVVERFVAEHPEFKITEQKSVPVVSLESLFIHFGTPDFLSIDIEGLDYDVLAHSLVWRKPKVFSRPIG